MPNPFLTPINKKGRYQDNKHHSTHSRNQDSRHQDHGRQVQENPFLCNKPNYTNSFSDGQQLQSQSHPPLQQSEPQPPPSFEELFPSLSQSSNLSNNQTKLNFKHAVQGPGSQHTHPHTQTIQSHEIQHNHQLHQPHPTQTQIRQNQFLRPTNQFLNPHPTNQFLRPMNDVRHRRYNDYGDDDNDNDNDTHDAYDSAYTKYYQD